VLYSISAADGANIKRRVVGALTGIMVAPEKGRPIEMCDRLRLKYRLKD